MTPEQWQHWILRFIAVTGGGAFVTCFILLALQPRSIFKWFMVCFGWVWSCFGTLFLLGAWQAALMQGPLEDHISAESGIAIGVGLWLVGLILAVVGWFVGNRNRGEPDAPPQDETDRLCERHARSINVYSLLGVVLLFVVLIGILNWFGSGGLRSWMFPMVAITFQLPSLLKRFVFLPRCGACGIGRMKITSSRPVRYCCKDCGTMRETGIYLGNRSSG